MIAALALLLMMGDAGPAPSALEQFHLHNREARAARERADHRAYLRHVRAVRDFVPGNASVRYALARAHALNGQEEAALAELATLARQGFAYKVLDEPAFARMADAEAFRKVAAELLANETGDRAARRDDVELPDGMRGEPVAWSPENGSFLLGGEGGVHSLEADRGPSHRLLTKWDAQVLGIRPEPGTGSFLVCVNHERAGTSQVARHRLSDGALLATYPLPASRALCNDIALLPGGGFAVTDSNNSLVFRLDRGRLVPLRLGRPIFLPNGIAADPAAGRLFVADAAGIVVHDLATAASRHLESDSTSIAALDGMVWHDGALVGVQNQTVPARLLHIVPDAAARRAEVAVLLSDPALGRAATVAAVGKEAFVYSRPEEDGGERPKLVRVRL